MQLYRSSLGKGNLRRSIYQVLMYWYAGFVVIQCCLEIWLPWCGKMAMFGSLQYSISGLYFWVCWATVSVGVSVLLGGSLCYYKCSSVGHLPNLQLLCLVWSCHVKHFQGCLAAAQSSLGTMCTGGLSKGTGYGTSNTPFPVVDKFFPFLMMQIWHKASSENLNFSLW